MTGQPMPPNSHAGWIDTHVHMDDARFADAHAVRDAARNVGIARLVIPAIGPVNFQAVRTLAHGWGDAYALGLHPMYLPADADAALAELEATLKAAPARSVFGGDKARSGWIFRAASGAPAMRALQEHCFAAQLRLAQRFDLPVILHVRQSVDAVLKCLRQLPPPGEHCPTRLLSAARSGRNRRSIVG